jgi:hypothetical protein
MEPTQQAAEYSVRINNGTSLVNYKEILFLVN